MQSVIILRLAYVRFFFFFSSRRRHTRCLSDWSSDVCSSDLGVTCSGHRPLHVTPSATSENNSGVVRLIANLPFVVASCVRLQLRPLPSTGVTRLRQYYEPLRHPKRPGLSLTSCQLIHTAITAGTSRVAYGPLCLHAVANTPAGRMELVRSYDSIRFGLPPNSGRVGSCITIFGACSAFTHVTACTLAESP